MDALQANGLKSQIQPADLEPRVKVTRQEEVVEEEWSEGKKYREDVFNLKWPIGSAKRKALGNSVKWFEKNY